MPKTRRSTTRGRGAAPPVPRGRGAPPPAPRGRGTPLPIPPNTTRGRGSSRGHPPPPVPTCVDPSLTLGDIQALIRQEIGQALATAPPSSSPSTIPTTQPPATTVPSERTVCGVVL